MRPWNFTGVTCATGLALGQRGVSIQQGVSATAPESNWYIRVVFRKRASENRLFRLHVKGYIEIDDVIERLWTPYCSDGGAYGRGPVRFE